MAATVKGGLVEIGEEEVIAFTMALVKNIRYHYGKFRWTFSISHDHFRISTDFSFDQIQELPMAPQLRENISDYLRRTRENEHTAIIKFLIFGHLYSHNREVKLTLNTTYEINQRGHQDVGTERNFEVYQFQTEDYSLDPKQVERKIRKALADSVVASFVEIKERLRRAGL